MATQVASYYPQRASVAVRSKTYDARVNTGNLINVDLGAPVALNSTGILAAQSIASATSTTTFAAAYTTAAALTTFGRWGRALRYVASGASTSVVTVTGRDYMNQKMQEVVTLNGATPVLGLKAFRYIDTIAWTATGATTMDVGWRDCFGLPVKSMALINEIKNQAVAANAGTFVAGLLNATAATSGNADVRGTYLPATVLPDGTNTFFLTLVADKTNLDGNAQFTT